MPKRSSARKSSRRGPQHSKSKNAILNLQSRREALLPTIDGPKLGPFLGSTASNFNIRFEELLDHPSSSGGGEGYVFRAFIHDTQYAVKLVSILSLSGCIYF